jgi:hypothetical protein
MQAVAEGKSRLSNQFARNLLQGTTNTRNFLQSQFAGSASLRNAGDYMLAFDNATTPTEIRVTATGSATRGVKGSNVGNWTLPQ